MARSVLAVVLIVLALGCICSSTYQILSGQPDWGLFSFKAIQAYVFHSACMVCGCMLMAPMRSREKKAQDAPDSPTQAEPAGPESDTSEPNKQEAD